MIPVEEYPRANVPVPFFNFLLPQTSQNSNRWSGHVSVRRIVPDIKSKLLDASREFYADVLGLEVAMDMGFIVTLASPSNPTAQVNLMKDDDSSVILPQMSVEVADIDEVHARNVSRRLNIVYPLTSEPWGVRRFFVTDPNGIVINVMSHIVEEAESD